MELRRYGRTDLYLSPLCFGPMRFSERTPGALGNGARLAQPSATR